MAASSALSPFATASGSALGGSPSSEAAAGGSRGGHHQPRSPASPADGLAPPWVGLLAQACGLKRRGTIPVGVPAHDLAFAKGDHVSEFGFDGHPTLLASRRVTGEDEYPAVAKVG